MFYFIKKFYYYVRVNVKSIYFTYAINKLIFVVGFGSLLSSFRIFLQMVHVSADVQLTTYIVQ